MTAPMITTAAPARSTTSARHQRLAVLAAAAAVLLSAALGVAALVDRQSGETLAEHATTVYAPHGEDPNPDLLYALVITVAVTGVGLWLAVLQALRSGRWWAGLLAGTVLAVTGSLALTLLAASEYGERVFPPVWGAVALLGPLAGGVTVGSLLAGFRDRFRSAG